MNKNIFSKVKGMVKFILPLYLFTLLPLLTSCGDFFDQESDHVIYSEHEHLNNAVDTIYSVTGILSKLQTLADRTILLGEVRGDLIDLTSAASDDLRELARFSVSDDNAYNNPADYYAVINNCNYFIAHADTALRNNRNEYVFMREYAAVKAIRAWTYLQLVLNYGSVPFVTEPVLTKEQSETRYPRYELLDVCQYFISDLNELPERYNNEYPAYRLIRNTDSRFFYFPLSIVRAELYLWAASAGAGQEYYRQAALNYYKYIAQRNGSNSTYPTGTSRVTWPQNTTTWSGGITDSWSYGAFMNETYGQQSELITMIPGDSIRAEGNYSELRNMFNSREENDYKPSLTPSVGMQELSESQIYCALANNGHNAIYAPKGLNNHRTGDLRLSATWDMLENVSLGSGNERIDYQIISKYSTRNVHIYRRQMVYLRMAEALNQAGYPSMAFAVLSTGLNNRVIADTVLTRHTSADDSLFISQFDFNNNRYGIYDSEDVLGTGMAANHNTMGIHSHGSGWTPMNEYYVLPNDTIETDPARRVRLIAEQQAVVDSLILNEAALEFAFEGTRYYDLMRFALRSANPGLFMERHILARRGKDATAEMQTEIRTSLRDPHNWYLSWKNSIGY